MDHAVQGWTIILSMRRLPPVSYTFTEARESLSSRWELWKGPMIAPSSKPFPTVVAQSYYEFDYIKRHEFPPSPFRSKLCEGAILSRESLHISLLSMVDRRWITTRCPKKQSSQDCTIDTPRQPKQSRTLKAEGAKRVHKVVQLAKYRITIRSLSKSSEESNQNANTKWR